MRRSIILIPVLIAGCFGHRSVLLGGHDYRTQVQLARLLDDMDDVKRKLNEPPPPVRQLAPATEAPVQRNRRTGRISARVMFAGGHLKLVAIPERAPDEVVLAVRPVATLDQECAVRLYRDGQRLDVRDSLRRSDHELLVSVPVDQLGKSDRFSGTACGRRFELDRAGRETVAAFVARFHERVDELTAPAVTNVANAQ